MPPRACARRGVGRSARPSFFWRGARRPRAAATRAGHARDAGQTQRDARRRGGRGRGRGAPRRHRRLHRAPELERGAPPRRQAPARARHLARLPPPRRAPQRRRDRRIARFANPSSGVLQPSSTCRWACRTTNLRVGRRRSSPSWPSSRAATRRCATTRRASASASRSWACELAQSTMHGRPTRRRWAAAAFVEGVYYLERHASGREQQWRELAAASAAARKRDKAQVCGARAAHRVQLPHDAEEWRAFVGAVAAVLGYYISRASATTQRTRRASRAVERQLRETMVDGKPGGVATAYLSVAIGVEPSSAGLADRLPAVWGMRCFYGVFLLDDRRLSSTRPSCTRPSSPTAWGRYAPPCGRPSRASCARPPSGACERLERRALEVGEDFIREETRLKQQSEARSRRRREKRRRRRAALVGGRRRGERRLDRLERRGQRRRGRRRRGRRGLHDEKRDEDGDEERDEERTRTATRKGTRTATREGTRVATRAARTTRVRVARAAATVARARADGLESAADDGAARGRGGRRRLGRRRRGMGGPDGRRRRDRRAFAHQTLDDLCVVRGQPMRRRQHARDTCAAAPIAAWAVPSARDRRAHAATYRRPPRASRAASRAPAPTTTTRCAWRWPSAGTSRPPASRASSRRCSPRRWGRRVAARCDGCAGASAPACALIERCAADEGDGEPREVRLVRRAQTLVRRARAGAHVAARACARGADRQARRVRGARRRAGRRGRRRARPAGRAVDPDAAARDARRARPRPPRWGGRWGGSRVRAGRGAAQGGAFGLLKMWHLRADGVEGIHDATGVRHPGHPGCCAAARRLERRFGPGATATASARPSRAATARSLRRRARAGRRARRCNCARARYAEPRAGARSSTRRRSAAHLRPPAPP